MAKLSLRLIFTSLILVLSQTPVYAQESVYIVGVVPQFEAKKLRSIWQPIINYLTTETGYQFKIKGSPTIPKFEKEFLKGDFDFAYMNPYHFILANESEKYIPMVRDVGRTLHGVLVVKKESDITELSQLDGQVIAFPSPNALGASLQMRQELVDNFKLTFSPHYVKTHDSVYLNVLLGEAAAGGGVQSTLNRQPAEYRAALKVIHQTEDVAPHPFAVHPRVPAKVVSAVKMAMLKLGETESGRILLLKIPMKKIGLASMTDYLPLKDLKLDRFFVK